jgi:hypothetical protein
VDDPGHGQRKKHRQPLKPSPAQGTVVRPAREPPTPGALSLMPQLGQTHRVAGDAEVTVQPLERQAQPLVLRAQRPMPHEAALLRDRFKRTRQAIPGHLLANHQLARFRAHPQVAKPEEVETRSQPESPPC